jgi:dCMP deaminase
MSQTWDEYYLTVAAIVAARADCTRAKHGAVLVDGRNRIRAAGFNGPPPNSGKKCPAGDCPRAHMDELPHLSADYSNCIAIHAEQNALANADRADCLGGTLYITGKPCDMCFKLITAAGLYAMVYPDGPDIRSHVF